MYYALGNHIYSFSSMTTCIPCLADVYFSLFMSITFEVVQTCVSIQNTVAHEWLSDSNKYFTFVSHICSLPSMIPFVFLVWWSHLFFFSNTSEGFTVIHKYFKLAVIFVVSHI